MEVEVSLPDVTLPGYLDVPEDASGLVVFAHGSGSSRESPRNQQVASGLNAAGLATLLFDILTAEEGRLRRNVFDIDLLAERMMQAVDWAGEQQDASDLPVGLFGASTGAAAALDAAAERPEAVRAVVSRGGRPDLASKLTEVARPVLLIVGGHDEDVLDLNRSAAQQLQTVEVEVVPGAGHLFEGPGELEQVTELARNWFDAYL